MSPHSTYLTLQGYRARERAAEKDVDLSPFQPLRSHTSLLGLPKPQQAHHPASQADTRALAARNQGLHSPERAAPGENHASRRSRRYSIQIATPAYRPRTRILVRPTNVQQVHSVHAAHVGLSGGLHRRPFRYPIVFAQNASFTHIVGGYFP